jgi:Uma2 family endonuclease
MVANSTIDIPWTPALEAIPPSALAGRGALVRFTVDDVLSMIRRKSLAEDARTELLNGYIVQVDRSSVGGDPSMHSPGHRKSVRLLTALVGKIDSPLRTTQIQLPIVCAERQMPEPDFAVVRGTDDDFTDGLPPASEVHCVVEVADSSLERDRGEKLPIYARAGIPQYIIINLRNRTAEVYANPDSAAGTYPPATIVTEQQRLALRVGDAELFSVDLASLLP